MRIVRQEGPAADFHAMPVPADLTDPEARIFTPTRPALVLGSGQREDAADPDAVAAARVDVVRRRSGGGAVLLVPGNCLWVDVFLPRTDRRWDDDVTTSSEWLGELWAEALAELGVAAEVYRGNLQKTPWGRLVCFGAVGPGEVTVAGRKLVGVSQRRTRDGARFQCMVLERWDPGAIVALLRLGDDDERARAVADLRDVATGLWPYAIGELEATVTGLLAAE